MKAKFRDEEEEAKRKAKEERERWKEKIEKEEREEKEKKKKQEREMEDEMRKKMSKFGFQENQIDAVLHPRRADRLPVGALPDNPIVQPTPTAIATVPYRSPTFVKIHKDYIDVETLRYYGLSYEYDVVSLDGADNFFIQLIQRRTVTILSFFTSLTPMRQIVCSNTLACYVVATQQC